LQGKEEEITSVAEEVGIAMERRVEEILRDAIKRAKENHRRTLHARDL
jgi:histone H3/H4